MPEPEMRISREEAWRRDYRRERYLQGASDDDLLKRIADLISSLLLLSPDGRVSLKVEEFDTTDLGLGERLANALEELRLRGVDYRDQRVITALQTPRPRSPKVQRAFELVRDRTWPTDFLFKFGERKYLEPLYRKGIGRISSASSYDNPSLNRAQRDNEREVFAYVHPIDAHRLMAIRTQTDSSGRLIEQAGTDVLVQSVGTVGMGISANADYYVYCVTKSFDARLFDDFPRADSCLVIKEPQEFTHRLSTAVKRVLPAWSMVREDVFYFDPYFTRIHQLEPFFSKHFRFAYQQEHRFVWTAPEPSPSDATISHLPLDLDPLLDCTELICL